MTADGVGTCGADDNQAQAGHILAIHENQRGELVTKDVTGTLNSGGGKPGQGYPCVMVAPALTARYGKGTDSDASDAMVITSLAVAGDFSSSEGVAQTVRAAHGQSGLISVQPVALRGREGGAQIEVGAEGAPYNALRAGDGGSSRQSLIAVNRHSDTVVRRLTPTECERLQGFPDGWTDGQSDAQRYRQMGNAVAVPVVEWIARRLIAVDEAP